MDQLYMKSSPIVILSVGCHALRILLIIMSRFKNTKVTYQGTQRTLKDLLGEGGFSFVYTTDDPSVVCKIQVITVPDINQSYLREKKVLQKIKHPNIVALIAATETGNKDEKLGFLFLEACRKGSLWDFIQKAEGDIEEESVYSIAYEVASAIQALHSQNIIHRDIKLENILLTDKGVWKLCDFGSATDEVIDKVDKENRVAIEQEIQKKTTPIYRSPQQLDLYSNFQVGPKVDIFALGCVIFMICFKKQPFQGKLASINSHYFLPEKHPYSTELINLINWCFVPNPKNRPSANELVKKLEELLKKQRSKNNRQLLIKDANKELGQLIEDMKKLSHVKQQDKAVSSSLVDKMKRLYAQMTTQTQGWIEAFIEESDQSPNLKYNKAILAKCWQKRYKVDKVFLIISEQANHHIRKPLVVIKILLLLHDFLRKGPPEAVNHKEVGVVCAKIFGKWKFINNGESGQKQRKGGLVIQAYSILVYKKYLLCKRYNNFIEGNYSPTPFFTKRKESKILDFEFLDDLLQLLGSLLGFHQTLTGVQIYPQIKNTILLSLIDEQYCLVCLFVHLLCALKQATNFIKVDVDEVEFKNRLKEVESRFKVGFQKLEKVLAWQASNSQAFKANKVELNEMVLFYIEGLETFTKKNFIFDITDYFNFQTQIYGLKLPQSYEGALKDTRDIKAQGSQQVEFLQFQKYRQQLPPVQPLKPPSLINSIKGNFDFFSKPQDNMQYSHQSINKDFASSQQMEQLRNSKVEVRVGASSLNQFVNTDGFAPPKPQFQLNVQHQQVQSRIVRAVNPDQKPDRDSLSLSQTVEPFVPSISNADLITFEDEQEDNKYENPIQVYTGQIPAQMTNSIVFGNFQSPQILGKSSVIKSVTIQQVQSTIPYDKLRVFECIEQNHFYSTSRGVANDVQEVIVRRLSPMLSQRSETIQHLLELEKVNPHVNVASFIGISKDGGNLITVEQHCQGQSLYTILHNSAETLTWEGRVSIAKQIAQGLMFLHFSEPSVVHRQLNSHNVHFMYPCGSGKSLKIKITCCGLDVPFKWILVDQPQYIKWMAPQIFNEHCHSAKSDIYSLSIILWELISRRVPYGDSESYELLVEQIDRQGVRPDLEWISERCPRSFLQLMTRCWNPDPCRRPQIRQAVQILNEIKFQSA